MEEIEGRLREYIKDLPKEILEITDSIYLYGSMARGDVCDDSDCDLLIAIEDCDSTLFEQMRVNANEWHHELKCELALYPISALRIMQKKGSLFLWHIKTQGICLFARGSKLRLILDNLPTYTDAKRDISEYAEIMTDIETDSTDDISIIEYNLSIIATLIRNICIISCYMIGNMQFGRVSPIDVCTTYWLTEFPINTQEYLELYRYRIAVNRGGEVPIQADLERYYNEWKVKTSRLILLAFSLLE